MQNKGNPPSKADLERYIRHKEHNFEKPLTDKDFKVAISDLTEYICADLQILYRKCTSQKMFGCIKESRQYNSCKKHEFALMYEHAMNNKNQ